MTNSFAPIALYLASIGTTTAEIEKGREHAEAVGYGDADEGLSLALSCILYDEHAVAEGARYPVEPGSIDWAAYHG